MSPYTTLAAARPAAPSADRRLRLVVDDADDAAAPTPTAAPPAPCDQRCDFCSAQFLAGPGWAWRVTAALSRDRRAQAATRARSA